MTTDPAETSADPFEAMLQAQRANRAETSRAEIANAGRSAAALAAGILTNEPAADGAQAGSA